jgi:hypothetical protein
LQYWSAAHGGGFGLERRAACLRLEQQLAERIPTVDIIDALSDTEHWLNWSSYFGPISGHDAKLENPRERYLITTFCYGCNLGPTQTARSIKGLDRRQVSFVNQRHITEENLNQAITRVCSPGSMVWPTLIGAGPEARRAPAAAAWGSG